MNMDFIFEPPVNYCLVILLSIVAGMSVLFCLRGFRQFFHTENYARARCMLKGIRGLLVFVASVAWIWGILRSEPWPLIIGLIILGQELYEGAVLMCVLRMPSVEDTPENNTH